jgi:hypothetical protein
VLRAEAKHNVTTECTCFSLLSIFFSFFAAALTSYDFTSLLHLFPPHS